MVCNKFSGLKAAVFCLGGLVVLLGLVPRAFSQDDYWTGSGADKLWSNPDNWNFGEPPVGGEIRVNGPEAEGGNSVFHHR